MQRITDATASAALPAPPSLAGATIGYFTGGVAGSVPATRVRYWWLNMIQEEAMAILAAGGVTPDTTATVFNQILTALQKVFVSLSHMSIFGTVLNSGGPNISATVSFTPTFNGILIVTGAAAQQAGEFTAVSQTLTGVTDKAAYGNNSAGATSNLSNFGSSGTVTAGTPVTLTASMTGTGESNSFTNIGFNYVVLPTS